MGNILKHFRDELSILKKNADSELLIEDYIPLIEEIIEVFENQGQSGGSAPFYSGTLANTIKNTLMFEPLSRITGEDWEWVEVEKDMFQNSRLGSLLKYGKDEKPIYLDAIVWQGEDDWDRFSGTIEGITSRQYAKLPFMPKTFTIDVYRELYDKDNPKHNVGDSVECGSGTYVYFIKDKTQLEEVWKYYEPYTPKLKL